MPKAPGFDPERSKALSQARRAAGDAGCVGAPGARVPAIDRDRCEGKYDCIAVCPYDVFRAGILPKAQRRQLSFRGRLKAWGHGGRQVFLENPQDCRACGLCVAACPEDALSLPG